MNCLIDKRTVVVAPSEQACYHCSGEGEVIKSTDSHVKKADN